MGSEGREQSPSQPGGKLKREHPILHIDSRSGSQKVKRLVSPPEPQEDPFQEVDTATGKKTKLTAHERETVYALLDRKDVPASLRRGLRTQRNIRKRIQQAKSSRYPIYSPFEDPPETE